MHRDRLKAEREHFDHLVELQGETWWGNTTEAGAERMRRRARLLSACLAAYVAPRVLELGCGTGTFSVYLLAEIPDLRLEGVDPSMKAVNMASQSCRERPHARFMVGDALALPYADMSLDAVVGNSVLHHLPLQRCIVEAHRVLKPGGLFFFSEPNMLNPQVAIEKNFRWVRRLSQTTSDETAFFRWPLQRELRRAGFREATVKPYDFMHPLIPKRLIRVADAIGRFLEHAPLLREISGSLLIQAVK